MLVLATLGAPERRAKPPRGRRRARDAPAEPPPEPVPTTRATLVDTAALDGLQTAERWLREVDGEALGDDATARLNRVLHAHRAASADPHVREVAREQALVVRVGFGGGEQVSEGRWDRARELRRPDTGAPRRPGRAALRPQERLAALLGGRDAVLACEELTLRARSDLDAGRLREGALQLRVALEAALAELEPWRELASVPERLDALRDRRSEAGAVADAALQGGLDTAQAETVRGVLEAVEAALRARSAGVLR